MSAESTLNKIPLNGEKDFQLFFVFRSQAREGQQSHSYCGFFLFSDVLALPIFKQEDSSLPPENEAQHPPFQYVMCAATSPAVKLYDETLTYLNQGWYAYVAGITTANAAYGVNFKARFVHILNK